MRAVPCLCGFYPGICLTTEEKYDIRVTYVRKNRIVTDTIGVVKTILFSLFLEETEGGGGLLYWGPCRICRGKLWRRTFLSVGAPLGNLEGGSFTGDFER